MPEQQSPKPVALYDTFAMKAALDEAVVKFVVEEYQFAPDYSLSNVKIVLGLISIFCATFAHFYWEPYSESKPVSITCVLIYLFISAVLQYLASFVERDSFLLTKPHSVTATAKGGLKISSQLPRFSENYTLRIEFRNAPLQVALSNQSVGNYFSSDGRLLEGKFVADAKRHLDQLLSKASE